MRVRALRRRARAATIDPLQRWHHRVGHPCMARSIIATRGVRVFAIMRGVAQLGRASGLPAPAITRGGPGGPEGRVGAPMPCQIYVLESEHDGKLYIGVTKNLKMRFKRHQAGLVRSTKARRPFRLLGYKTFDSFAEAHLGEVYAKRLKDPSRVRAWIDA